MSSTGECARSMAFQVEIMPRAASDVERIYRHVIQQAPLTGQRWHNGLIGALSSLEKNPHRCLEVAQLSNRGRIIRRMMYGVKPHCYKIYFDIVGDTVRVLHIRHAARRVLKRL